MMAANVAGVDAILFGVYASAFASGHPCINLSGCQCSIAFCLAAGGADRTDFAGHWRRGRVVVVWESGRRGRRCRQGRAATRCSFRRGTPSLVGAASETARGVGVDCAKGVPLPRLAMRTPIDIATTNGAEGMRAHPNRMKADVPADLVSVEPAAAFRSGP
jgi:hypothetical protein